MVKVAEYAAQGLQRARRSVPYQALARPNKQAGQAQDESSVSISREAKQLLASLKGLGAPVATEARTLSDLAATLRDAMKVTVEQLAHLQRAGRDPGKRIAEIREKLRQLLQRMQRTALMGDKRAAAAIAKEAAGLAKDLAAATKDAAAEAREQGSDAATDILVTLPMIPTAPAAPPEAGDSSKTDAGSFTAEKAASGAGVAVDAHLPGTLDEGLMLEISKAVAMLRGILALARQTVEKKGHHSESRKADQPSDLELRKAVALALKVLEESEASIKEDTGPRAVALEVGWHLHVATEA